MAGNNYSTALRLTNERKKKLNLQGSTRISPDWFATYDKEQFPPRNGNSIEPIIDGEETFRSLYFAILNAKKSIYIATWAFMPGMRLIRGKNSVNSNGPLTTEEQKKRGLFAPYGLDTIGELLLKKAKEGIEVKLLIWGVLGSATLTDMTNYAAETVRDAKSAADSINGSVNRSPLLKAATMANMPLYAATQLAAGAKDLPKDINPFNNPLYELYYQNDLDWWVKARLLSKINNSNFRLRYQNHPESIFNSFHQKNVIIDDSTSYCMGANFNVSDWDTSKHHVYNPWRDPLLGPRNDVSVIVKGPTVRDFCVNFAQRWSHGFASKMIKLVEAKPLTKINPGLVPVVIPTYAEEPGIDKHLDTSFLNEKLNLNIAPYKTGGRAQVNRTMPSLGKLKSERKIFEVYKNAISNAQHYIYINNQYFRDPAISKLIAKRIDETKGKLEVILVIPSPGGLAKWYTRDSFKDIKKAYGRYNKEFQAYTCFASQSSHDISIKALDYIKMADKWHGVTANPRDLLLAATLLWGENDPRTKELKHQYKPFYVKQYKKYYNHFNFGSSSSKQDTYYREVEIHTKILLVDDFFMTIGSANINERSMKDDGEINISVTDKEIVKKFRIDLWKRLTGLEGTFWSSEYLGEGTVPSGIKTGIKDIKERAEKNKQRMKNKKWLRGEVMPLDIDPQSFGVTCLRYFVSFLGLNSFFRRKLVDNTKTKKKDTMIA